MASDPTTPEAVLVPAEIVDRERDGGLVMVRLLDRQRTTAVVSLASTVGRHDLTVDDHVHAARDEMRALRSRVRELEGRLREARRAAIREAFLVFPDRGTGSMSVDEFVDYIAYRLENGDKWSAPLPSQEQPALVESCGECGTNMVPVAQCPNCGAMTTELAPHEMPPSSTTEDVK